MKTSRFERGQALVLIVLAIVAMFGFAALAVDIGRLYAERRRVQSAADAAVLAAAFAASQAQDYEAAALNQLSMNDIFDTDANRNEDVRIDVEVYNPPVSGAYGPESGRTEEERSQFYQVIVHSAVDQVFSQFVYQGPLDLTVEAVARVRKASGLYSGDVLHATSPDACQGIKFAGNSTTHLTGGNAFSDSRRGEGCGGGGSASCTSAVLSGSGDVIIEGGGLNLSGSWNVNGGGVLTADGGVQECQVPNELPYIKSPDCSHLPNRSFDKNVKIQTLQPGIYESGIQVTNPKGELHLEPGLYCLNADFSMNGGVITGQGVMIYMARGDFVLGGSTAVNLMAVAPGGTSIIDGAGEEWSGMLLFMPYDNAGEVKIGGGSTSKYSGTIYAPGPRKTSGQDKCVIEGSGTSLGIRSNIICDTVKIVGSAAVNIDYLEDENFRMPATIELAQ